MIQNSIPLISVFKEQKLKSFFCTTQILGACRKTFQSLQNVFSVIARTENWLKQANASLFNIF